MSNDNAPMGEPLSEAEDAAARIRAYLDACSGANSFGREIRWELRDAEGQPYNLTRADLVAVLDGLAAEAKDCEILEEGYINAMDDYGKQLTEVEQLRARVGVLAGQLAKARELSATWLRNAENVRNSADRLPGLSKVEKAELKQGAIELEHCAHQLRNTLGLDGGGSDER